MRTSVRRVSGGLLVAVTTVCILYEPLFAWSSEVHMTIAYIAYERLQPPVRAKVDGLIQLNPMAPRWTAALQKYVKKPHLNEALFMEAATWPDLIATDGSYHDGRGVAGPTGVTASGYGDTSRHREWHFAPQPFSTDGSPLPAVATPNALTEIARMRRELASSATGEAVRLYDLTWIVHLIGDVHQPLHVATRVSQAAPRGDFAGTDVRLCGGCRLSLHDLWDSILGTTASVAAAAALTKQLPTEPPPGSEILDERVWAAEGLTLLRRRPIVAQ